MLKQPLVLTLVSSFSHFNSVKHFALCFCLSQRHFLFADVDIFQILIDAILPQPDLSLDDIVQFDEQCDAIEEVYPDILGFTPEPFKQGWSTLSLGYSPSNEDKLCVEEDGCDDSIGSICCDRVNEQGNIDSYQCGANGQCEAESTPLCLGIGSRCDTIVNPSAIPCCHAMGIDGAFAGDIRYVECEQEVTTESADNTEGTVTSTSSTTTTTPASFCRAPDEASIERSCTASGYSCTSSEECCQYSDPLVYSNVQECYKGTDENGNEAETGVCEARRVSIPSTEPFCELVLFNF